MDLNNDGVISLEEFIETCRRVGQGFRVQFQTQVVALDAFL